MTLNEEFKKKFQAYPTAEKTFENMDDIIGWFKSYILSLMESVKLERKEPETLNHEFTTMPSPTKKLR